MGIQYLIHFEEKLQEELLRHTTAKGVLKGVLLATDDIDKQWKILAPEYMADAVPQIPLYPTVSVAWAAYLGMAIAYGWESNWETFAKMPYQSYYGTQGFDDMDEHIVRDILRIPLNTRTANELEETIRQCGEKAINLIRYEQIPPQSRTAFHVFARACKTMFRIGAAIQLKRMGYHYEKVNSKN